MWWVWMEEKEPLHYPLFMVEALMKVLYWWKFKIGRIVLIILFLEFLILQQSEERRRWGKRDLQTDGTKTRSIFCTRFPDFDGKSWCIGIRTMEVLYHHLCVGEFFYWNPFVFFAWKPFPMDQVMDSVSNTFWVDDIFHFSFFYTRYDLRGRWWLLFLRGKIVLRIMTSIFRYSISDHDSRPRR